MKLRYKFTYSISGQNEQIFVEINLANEENAFIAGHTIDGRVLFPATGYLELVWRKFAHIKADTLAKTPVIFENVVLHQATIIPKEGSVRLSVTFFDGSNCFEVCESRTLVVSGKISVPENIDKEFVAIDQLPMTNSKNSDDLPLLPPDIYRELRLRGYDYHSQFKGLVRVNSNASAGLITWHGNWVTYMDFMLQFSILGGAIRELYLPTRFEKIIIDPNKHYNYIKTLPVNSEGKVEVPVSMYNSMGIIKSGGVEIRGMTSTQAPRRIGIHPTPILEQYTFIPYNPDNNMASILKKTEDLNKTVLSILIHKVIENNGGALKVKVAEVVTDETQVEELYAKFIQSTIDSEPLLISDIVVVGQNSKTFNEFFQDSDIQVLDKNPCVSIIENDCDLILCHDIMRPNDIEIMLSNLKKSLRPNGFIIMVDSNSSHKMNRDFVGILSKQDLKIISTQFSENNVFILLRPRHPDDMKRLINVIQIGDAHNLNWLENLKRAIVTSETDKSQVFIVSHGDETFGGIGLINCLKNEPGGRNVRLYLIMDKNAPAFEINSQFYADQIFKDLVVNVFKNGEWGSYVHLKLNNQNDGSLYIPVEHAIVNTLVKGDLSSLRWIESPLGHRIGNDKGLSSNKELCTVYYAPLNFKDIMLSTGKLAVDSLPKELWTEECVIGLEMAGRDSEGKRVMALANAKCLATTCEIDKKLKWYIPDNWTMEQAATVPCVYSTAYYAILMRGKARKGESILIHAGSGGVGQAAISVSLHHGLNVFTTVGNNEKIKFLMKTFPQLNQSYIGNSRDASFEQMIMRETNGQGVDLVLNSLTGESLQASVRCLGLNGRFLEIGKFDLNNNTPLGMSVFLKNSQFHGIFLDSVMEYNDEEMVQINKLVENGIKAGAVRPLQTNLYEQSQIEQAFRFMASGKHIGKVVIKLRDEEENKIMLPPLKLVNALPRTYLHRDKTYIIVGGLGGFGLELANWFVLRGARKLVISSRNGVRTGYQSLMIRRWKERGVSVQIDTSDVSTLNGARNLLNKANSAGSVGGIINLAAVIKDGLFQNLSISDFDAVCKSKIEITKNLDIASRKLCPDINYFICFSSQSCGRGNAGQANYGYANSGMERICEYRQKLGLPATAIQWAAIGDTGIVIESMEYDNNSIVQGTHPQRMVSCLQIIDYFMQQPHPILSSMVIAEKRKADGNAGVSLVDSVFNVLGIKIIKDIQENATLNSLGVDSLMVAEIKQNLERNFDIILSIPDIRQLTISKLLAIENKQPKDSKSDETTTIEIPKMIFDFNLLPDVSIVQLNNNSKGTPIFIVHPIEGITDVFRTIANNMAHPVYGLQCVKEAPLTSITTLAKFYIEQIKQMQKSGPYKIAGYSFGSTIAFEMVLQLENQKEKCHLAMIDGSPDFINLYTSDYQMKLVKDKDEDDANQNSALSFFATVAANLEYSKVCYLRLKCKFIY